MKNEKNALVYIKTTTRGGKKYNNLVIDLTLNNGEKVSFQVKQAFYNKKFAYKLLKGLDNTGAKNGKENSK